MAVAQRQRNGLLTALLEREPVTTTLRGWVLRRVGPRFEWLDHSHICIFDGPLSKRRFGITTDIRRNTANVLLHEDSHIVGQVEIERDPPGKGIILWDVAVREHLRGNGLATIMTWCAFRELLAIQDSATFRIRMVQSLEPGTSKPGASDAGIRNIGMGVIAARLGFRPELPMERIVHGDHITGIEALPGDNGNPPALKITLRCFPLVVIAFVLSPDTMKPISDYRTYLQLKRDDYLIQSWLRQGLLFVNGNYCLRDSGVERFVSGMATDEEEAALFRGKVRGL
jgi:hypothetical protein